MKHHFKGRRNQQRRKWMLMLRQREIETNGVTMKRGKKISEEREENIRMNIHVPMATCTTPHVGSRIIRKRLMPHLVLQIILPPLSLTSLYPAYHCIHATLVLGTLKGTSVRKYFYPTKKKRDLSFTFIFSTPIF